MPRARRRKNTAHRRRREPVVRATTPTDFQALVRAPRPGARTGARAGFGALPPEVDAQVP